MKLRRPKRRWRPAADPWRRVRIGVGMLAVIIVVGVSGYRILGLDFFEALYQTIITITTVGFEEVGTPDQIDDAYRFFTLGLAVFGVAGALYTLGVMVEAFVEGSLNDGLRLRREQRMVDNFSGHVIVAGAGRVGQAIVDYVSRHQGEVVVIDRLEDPDGVHPTIVGEATEDETLRRAGVERAATLIAALDSDAANVYVTLSARALNPDLTIVARTNDHSNEPKFIQAGADRVVNPHEIGGSRMGALAMHPTLAEFLDEVLRDDRHGVTIEEIEVPSASPAIGQTLGETVGGRGQPLVIALRDENFGYRANPSGDTVLSARMILVALGSADDVAALAAKVA